MRVLLTAMCCRVVVPSMLWRNGRTYCLVGVKKQLGRTDTKQLELVRARLQQKCQWYSHNPKIISGYLLDRVYIDSIAIVICQVFLWGISFGKRKKLVSLRTIHIRIPNYVAKFLHLSIWHQELFRPCVSQPQLLVQ